MFEIEKNVMLYTAANNVGIKGHVSLDSLQQLHPRDRERLERELRRLLSIASQVDKDAEAQKPPAGPPDHEESIAALPVSEVRDLLAAVACAAGIQLPQLVGDVALSVEERARLEDVLGRIVDALTETIDENRLESGS